MTGASIETMRDLWPSHCAIEDGVATVPRAAATIRGFGMRDLPTSTGRATLLRGLGE